MNHDLTRFAHASTRLLATALVAVFIAGGLAGCAGLAIGSAATGAVVANDPRTTGTQIEDQSIELKAARALQQDEQIEEQTHVAVISYNQVVLLVGQAPTEALRRRAGEIVKGVEKVRQIHNEIVVAAPSSMMARTNDTVLTTKVKTRLFANDELSANRVKVVTENGTVYLMGIVSERESDLAATIASTTSGVQKVVKLFE